MLKSLRRWQNFVPVFMLLLLFALLLWESRATSWTADEPTYIATGYAFLAEGKDVFPILNQRGYPPLLISLEAALLYVANPNIPVTELQGWPNSYHDFLQAFSAYLLPLELAKLITRVPMMWLTLLLAAVVFRWARRRRFPAPPWSPRQTSTETG